MDKPSSSERKKWAIFIGIPFQMAATIFLGYWIGTYLDGKYEPEHPWWTIGLTLFAVLVSLYQLIVQVKKSDQ